MNDQQYALLVLQLSALAQQTDALTTLNLDQLANLSFLLEEAYSVVAAEHKRQLRVRVAARNEEPLRNTDEE